jgi:hypothetical protein
MLTGLGDTVPGERREMSMKVLVTCFALSILAVIAGPVLAQTGACCILPCYVPCIDNVTQSECDSMGGQYLGDGTICEPPNP